MRKTLEQFPALKQPVRTTVTQDLRDSNKKTFIVHTASSNLRKETKTDTDRSLDFSIIKFGIFLLAILYCDLSALYLIFFCQGLLSEF